MRLAVLLSALLLASTALPAVAGGPARGTLAPPVGDVGGKPLALSDYRGKVLALVFWRASCTPCREQLPAFEELNRQADGKGLQVIAVNLGDSAKDYGHILRNLHRPTMVLAHDEGSSVADAWGVLMLPNVWLVDPEGRVLGHREGFVQADLPAIIDEIRRTAAAYAAAPAAPR
jgi:peroxiredoxin